MEIKQPVYELLHLIDGKRSVIAKIYYRMLEIQEKITEFTDISASQQSKLYQCFISRWGMLHTTLHAAGFVLDPEYPGMAQNSNEEVMTGFYQLVEQLHPNTELCDCHSTITVQIRPWYVWQGNSKGSCKAKSSISMVAVLEQVCLNCNSWLFKF